MDIVQQAQRIAESGQGNRRSVIIQMGGAPRGSGPMLRAASEVLSHRCVTLTARDSLPVPRDPKARATVATPRPMVFADRAALQASLSAHFEPTAGSAALGDLKEQSLEEIAPLLEHTAVRRSLGQGAELHQDRLWASGAVALELPPEDLVAVAKGVPGVKAIYPNRTLRVPPVAEAHNLPEKVLENRASSWGIERIGALATWGAYGARGEGVKVAVLDTGVDPDHPDLSGKIATWAEFDADGRQVEGSTPHDGDRHGTHVAGTIVGGNASGQWIGVAPEAMVCCAKVLGPAGGTDAQIQAGMSWAIEQDVDVINMSLGGLHLGPEMPATYTNAIVTALQRGIPVVIAVGNEGAETTGSPGNDVFALTVGATDHRDRSAGFSGGRTHIVYESEYISREALPLSYSKPELSAPGVAVVSAVPGGRNWVALNGSSMATPHVAGAIALLLSATSIRSLDPAERGFVLADLLIGSVEELGESGQDHRFGFGCADVLRAIGFAKERGY